MSSSSTSLSSSVGASRSQYKRSVSSRSADSELSYIAQEPEKEPLPIDVTALDEEYFPHLQSVLQVATERLWHWKLFPIVLPEPIIQKNRDATLSSSSSSRKKTLKLNQLFIAPNFNELREIALDSSGQPKKLTDRQLDSIKKTGEFEIDSVQFPGQKHRWVLTQILIKGKLKAHDTLNRDLARALYLIHATARDRILSDCFSVFNGINGWSQGLMSLLDIFFGMPLMKTVSLKDKIQEERSKYLVAELSCSSSETLKKLTEYLETQIQNGPTSSSTDPPPSIPYLFKTPHGFDIDLRLFNNDVMSTAKPHILHILSSGLHGWFMERKQDILNQLRKEETPEEEIDNRAYQILKREYLERVCEGVRKDQGIDSIGVGITELLVEQVKTSLIVDEILKETRERIRDHREKVEGQLKASQPVLCHIGPWMRRKLEASNEAYMNKHQWKAHEEAIASCKDAGLEQSAYFLSRDLTFRRDREPVLRKELRHLKYPEKTFKFTTYIWLPKNYVVMERKAPNRSYERIPTVISEREEYQYLAGTPDMDVHRFYLNKETYRTNSTKYPFWRWTNFFFRTWSWLWNTIFLLGVVVPWCSALSFRALIYKEPFYVEYELNPRNGSLQKKQNSRTETVLSRFKALWSHIRQSRKAFETQPDTGLLPRTVIRHFNRFVNYVIKGFFGSSFILLVLPVAIVSVSLTSLLLAATAPLWLVGASIIGHIFAAFTCDFDGTSYLGAVLWNVLINIMGLGILQPILAALVAFVFCPVGTCVLTLIAVIRKTLRDTWDALVFQLLIKKRARVPMSNTFLARRIAGPGMASEYYYQVRPEQALVALETRMEAAELKAYDNQTSQKILEPQKSCHNFLKRMFRPFGVMPSRKTAGPVMQLETESEELLAKLREKLEERWENLRPSLTGDVTARVKLQDQDLRTVLEQGILMVRDFFPPRVFTRMSKEQRIRFWEDRDLLQDDWLGLTSSLLKEFFSAGILTPLQETDCYFSLKVEHWNLERYVDMALDAKWKEDLDFAQVSHIRNATRQIRQPMIPIESFNPNSTYRPSFSNRVSFKSVFSRRWFVYEPVVFEATIALTSPVPIAHPADIVLVIYQRDNSTINFNVELIRNKLRIMREQHIPLECFRSTPPSSWRVSSSNMSSRRQSGSTPSCTPTNSLYEYAEDGSDSFEEAQERLKRRRRQQHKREEKKMLEERRMSSQREEDSSQSAKTAAAAASPDRVTDV